MVFKERWKWKRAGGAFGSSFTFLLVAAVLTLLLCATATSGQEQNVTGGSDLSSLEKTQNESDSSSAEAGNSDPTSVGYDSEDDDEQAALSSPSSSTSRSPLNCEIELTFSASSIDMPKFDSTFSIRNNRKSELNAWQVVWRFPSEKVIPGSVEGAILLATGTTRGSPARVVNTRTNVPILPFSSRGFTFTAYSVLDDTEEMKNVSRAPESVSVNGLSCVPVVGDKDNPAEPRTPGESGIGGDYEKVDRVDELCVPPDQSSDSSLSFLPSCVVSYCCGALPTDDTDDPTQQIVNQKAKEARHSLLPNQMILDEDDIAWSDCSRGADLVVLQNATSSGSNSNEWGQDSFVIAAMVKPGGYFGLCANTSVGPIFGEDYFDFYLLTNDERAVSLNILLGLSEDKGEPKSKLQQLVEADIPVYGVTDLNNNDPWKYIELDLKDLGVPGWAFFGIENNMKNADIPIFIYDLGVYATIDKAIAKARTPPTINWSALEQNGNFSFMTDQFMHKMEQPADDAMIPALLCSLLAILFVVVAASVVTYTVRMRKSQREKHSAGTANSDTTGSFSSLQQGKPGPVIRTYNGNDGGDGDSLTCIINGSEEGVFDVDFKKDVVLQEVLGSGGFGTVHKATWKGHLVAVKIMHGMIEGSQVLNNFKKEIDVLSSLKHPCIINFLAASLTPPDVCIIQELAEKGSLYTLLHGSGTEHKPLRYGDILQYGIDIADAMAYLHPTVVHRDLKSQNVLLDSNGRAKVCDFGIAKFKDKTFLTTVNSHAGTPSYMAPELFSAGDVSEKCDVFSYGVLLWECFTGCVPWDELSTPMQVIFAVGVQKQRLPIPPHCPTFLARLMADCWREDPHARPGFTKILHWLDEEHQRYIAQKSLRAANGGQPSNSESNSCNSP